MSKNLTLKSSQQSRDLLVALLHMSTQHNSAFMRRYVAITTGSKIRALLVSVHNVSNVDKVWEPLDVLLPRVIVVTQPPLKSSATMEVAGLISVPCKETIDRLLFKVEGTSTE